MSNTTIELITMHGKIILIVANQITEFNHIYDYSIEHCDVVSILLTIRICGHRSNLIGQNR